MLCTDCTGPQLKHASFGRAARRAKERGVAFEGLGDLGTVLREALFSDRQGAEKEGLGLRRLTKVLKHKGLFNE